MAELEAPELLDALIVEPWQPFKCDKIEYEEEEDDLLDLMDLEDENNDNNNNTLFQIKCQFSNQCIGILLTDLINVWYCEQSQSQIRSTQRKLNPAMESNTIQQINKQIQNMLCFSDQTGSNHAKNIIFNNENKTSLIMHISMTIENIIQFKWQLTFNKYGSAIDQATLLKQQLILPLMSIANELASKLNAQNNNNYMQQSNNNKVFPQKITDSFLQFNIRGTMANLYKNTMDFLTFSQMGGGADDNYQANEREHISNVVITNIATNNNRIIGGSALPEKPKGRKKKRVLTDSMEDKHPKPANKRMRKMYNDSDDDVLHGLIGREDDLKMSELDGNNDTMDCMTTNTMNHSVLETQQERQELKRREELRQKLEAKKKDTKAQKKKKKKKKKLRI